MTTWTFDSTAEGWTGSVIAFYPDDGNPDAGCLRGNFTLESFGAIDCSISGLSQTVTTSDYLWLYIRVAGTVTNDATSVGVTAYSMINNFCTVATMSIPVSSGAVDSGWIILSGLYPENGDLTQLDIVFGTTILGEPALYAYVDTVNSGEGPPPLPGAYDLIQSAGGIPGSIMVTT